MPRISETRESLSSTYAPVAAGAKFVASTGVAATDTAALVAAVAALPATGGTIYLDAGPYALTADTLSLTKPIHLIGSGPSGATVANGGSYLSIGTKITCDSATGVAIAVNADGCSFEKLYLLNTAGSTPSAGAGVQVQSYGKSTRIVDCAFEKFYVGVDFQYGYEWFATRCQFHDPVYAGLKIRNNYSVDAGDMVVSDSNFYAGPTNLTPTAAIRWESGGAPKFTGIKINNRGSGRFVSGIDMRIVDGGVTEGCYIAASSIENVDYGIRLGQLGPSNTGTMAYMTVVGVQFGGMTYHSIYIKPTATSLFIQKVAIVGNVLHGPTSGIYYERINYPTVVGNTVVGGTTAPVTWGSGTAYQSLDATAAVQTTLNGTTAGTAVSSMPLISQFHKVFLIYLNGYQNSGGVVQSIFPPVSFGTVARIVADTATSGATFDTAIRLPTSMGAPITGLIKVEGY